MQYFSIAKQMRTKCFAVAAGAMLSLTQTVAITLGCVSRDEMNVLDDSVISCSNFDAWHVVYLVHSNELKQENSPEQVSSNIFQYFGIVVNEGERIIIDVLSCEIRLSGFDQAEVEAIYDLVENFEMDDAIEYIKLNHIDDNEWNN